ncbi:tyrosine-type recombinase/integrase [Nocardioides cynanchi]|uniref:tyrosine-type recombinase/integrase n=1 Tax=Nocardioides cynanchi TaxID=2558918 RepID=UPI001245FF66|nr:site-specific integrase [Nocardioides cynanchi]
MTTASPTSSDAKAARKTRSRKATRTSFGSVRRLPSGRYQARYTDRQMNRHTAPQTFATKTHAEEWLATVRADVVRGTWRAPSLGAVTLAEYAADHLATRVDLAPRTQQLYASVVANWIATPLELPLSPGRSRTINLGGSELSAVSVASIREWHAAAIHRARRNAQARAEATKRRRQADARHAARLWALANDIPVKATGRLPRAVLDAWRASGHVDVQPLAEPESARLRIDAGRAQVAQAYRLLRMILGHAVREGRIDSNPCQIARAGQVKSTERVPATPAEIDALAAAMPERYSAAVHLAAWSGLRAGELFGLARRHVDLQAGTVRVERAVTYMPGHRPSLGETKTESSKRTVHLPPHVVAILREHMDRYTGRDPDALLFTDAGGQIVPRELRKAPFWRARAAVGRSDLRWHDLRHTGATLAAQAGATLAELQHRLGHATVAAAMLYQHHTADRDRTLASRLGALAGHPELRESPAKDV